MSLGRERGRCVSVSVCACVAKANTHTHIHKRRGAHTHTHNALQRPVCLIWYFLCDPCCRSSLGQCAPLLSAACLRWLLTGGWLLASTGDWLDWGWRWCVLARGRGVVVVVVFFWMVGGGIWILKPCLYHWRKKNKKKQNKITAYIRNFPTNDMRMWRCWGKEPDCAFFVWAEWAPCSIPVGPAYFGSSCGVFKNCLQFMRRAHLWLHMFFFSFSNSFLGNAWQYCCYLNC